jgi:predicted unusual protein kinase regulating ubiquinone biosynthesis (AarF/ABC1/UbiB family)
MLTDLSGFYLKIGQVFATKADLLPAAYPKSLRQLFDACSPAPYSTVLRTLRRELGADVVASSFSYIDPTPLATATIAQVHRAILADGSAVVVKVQHVGMEALMRSDIANMLRVVDALEALNLDLNFDQKSILKEYQAQVPFEFDFLRERAALERITASIANGCPTTRVRCPRAYPLLSTKRVLTMQFMDGPAFSVLQRALEPRPDGSRRPPPPGCSPEDFSKMMRELLTAFGQQIFVERLFHSDPHPCVCH